MNFFNFFMIQKLDEFYKFKGIQKIYKVARIYSKWNKISLSNSRIIHESISIINFYNRKNFHENSLAEKSI